VQQKVVPLGYFYTGEPNDIGRQTAANIAPRVPSVVNVYKFPSSMTKQPMAGLGHDTLRPFGGLVPAPLAQPDTLKSAIQHVDAAPTMPIAPIKLIPPDEIVPRTVDPAGPNSY
jgi:hypothetical protein